MLYVVDPARLFRTMLPVLASPVLAATVAVRLEVPAGNWW